MTPEERLAVAETQIGSAGKTLDEIRATVAQIDSRVKAIDDKLNRQKGFIAGAMFVGTFLWGTLLFSAKLLWDKIMGNGPV